MDIVHSVQIGLRLSAQSETRGNEPDQKLHVHLLCPANVAAMGLMRYAMRHALSAYPAAFVALKAVDLAWTCS